MNKGIVVSGPIIALIGAIIAAIATAVALVIPEGKKGWARITGGFAFLGALISAFGGLSASHESDIMQAKLYDKSEQLVELNREMLQTVTGGGSFCYVQPYIARDEKSAALVLFHRGKCAVYDAQIQVNDLSQADPPIMPDGSVHWEDALPKLKIVSLGNVLGNHAFRVAETITLPDGDAANFNIFFSARNGWWAENLAFRKINGYWRFAYRVFVADGDRQTILRWAPGLGFPKDSLPWPVGDEEKQ
jgi:hypothetical protein